MTTTRDITIYQGQAFALSLDYAGATGRGQRMHIRLADSTATVVQILTHNGDANARVLFDGTSALDITIGASVSAAWVVLADRVEWVYDIEDYDLADEDDCVIPYRGKVIVRGNRTRASDVTPSEQMPSGDGRYVRFDTDAQGLSDAQKLAARTNIGAGTGGGGGSAAWGDITGTLSAQTDLATALALKAPLASPTLTGTPAAPTAAGGTSTTQIATTAFAAGEITTHAGATDPHGDRAYADGLAVNYATAGHNHSGTYQPLATVLTNTTAAFTTAQETKLSGIEAAADVTDAGNVGTAIDGATAKTTPVDADTVPLIDSVASNVLKKLSWANIKATAKTYFDTLYQAALVSGTNIKTVNSTSLLGSGDIAISGGSSNTKWVGAGELIPRVTNGAGIDGEELATNDINLDYLAFDTATAEYAQVSFAWPSGFTTLTATFSWTAASGSGGVTWRGSARCYADDDALDQAQGTAISVSDTFLAANDYHKSSATATITPGGTVATGNLCTVEVSRNPADGSDTLAVDARLIGVLLSFA